MAADNLNTEDEVTYCAVHPDRETGLRCITCNRYMCVSCAVRTPVGYRCRECVRGQQQVFFKGKQSDDLVTFAITAALTGLVVGILAAVNLLWIWIAIIVGLPVGAGISELALRATQRRRSRYSHYVGAAGAVIGGLAGVLLPAFINYNNMIAQYNELISQLSPRELEAFMREMGAAVGSSSVINGGSFLPPLPEFLWQSLTLDIGALLMIGIIAFAIYGRYRMKM